MKKTKFKPVVTRIKLNPEQAVLWCECYNTESRRSGSIYWSLPTTRIPSCRAAKVVLNEEDCVTTEWFKGAKNAVSLISSGMSS